MKRISFVLLLAAGSFGCSNDDPTPATASTPSAESFPIEYANWPQLTEQPVNVPLAVMLDCRAPQPTATVRYGPITANIMTIPSVIS